MNISIQFLALAHLAIALGCVVYVAIVLEETEALFDLEVWLLALIWPATVAAVLLLRKS